MGKDDADASRRGGVYQEGDGGQEIVEANGARNSEARFAIPEIDQIVPEGIRRGPLGRVSPAL